MVARGSEHPGLYLKILVVALVVTQRFAIPLGSSQVPLILPLGLLILAIAFSRGAMTFHRVRAPLTLTVCLTALVCTLVQLGTGSVPSLLSMFLLVLAYLPAALVSTEGRRAVFGVSRLFVWIMTAAAVVALAQFGAQYVGLANVDYLGQALPAPFLVQGFSPNALISYGADLRRSNGYLFLEPSFLSLFLGLAVVVAIKNRSGWVRVTILLAGMVPTLAGNGLVVLLAGVVVSLFLPDRRRLLTLVPGLVGAVVAAAATPLGALYLRRSTEAGSSGSSSSFRFVQPYTTLLPATFDSPFHALFGHGAGNSDHYLDVVRNLIEVTRPAIPKVFFEYGVLGALGIAGALAAIMITGLRERPWMVGVLITYFFINASLLQPTLSLFALFWLVLLPAKGERRTPRYSRRERDSVPEPPSPPVEAPPAPQPVTTARTPVYDVVPPHTGD